MCKILWVSANYERTPSLLLLVNNYICPSHSTLELFTLYAIVRIGKISPVVLFSFSYLWWGRWYWEIVVKTFSKVSVALLMTSFVVGGVLMLFLFHNVLHWGYYSIVVNNGWAGFSPSTIISFDTLVIAGIIASALIALFAKPSESKHSSKLAVS